MKDLLSKGRYCYKIHTLLMETKGSFIKYVRSMGGVAGPAKSALPHLEGGGGSTVSLRKP